jgi:hypothetical protein
LRAALTGITTGNLSCNLEGKLNIFVLKKVHYTTLASCKVMNCLANRGNPLSKAGAVQPLSHKSQSYTFVKVNSQEWSAAVRTMPNWVLGDSNKPYRDSQGYIRPGKVLGR